MQKHKKGHPMRQLDVLPHKPRDTDKYHIDLIKQLNECDGAVLVMQKNRTLRLKYFGLHEEEIIHAFEWAKLKLLLED
jgi:hypothetical protein